VYAVNILVEYQKWWRDPVNVGYALSGTYDFSVRFSNRRCIVCWTDIWSLILIFICLSWWVQGVELLTADFLRVHAHPNVQTLLDHYTTDGGRTLVAGPDHCRPFVFMCDCCIVISACLQWLLKSWWQAVLMWYTYSFRQTFNKRHIVVVLSSQGIGLSDVFINIGQGVWRGSAKGRDSTMGSAFSHNNSHRLTHICIYIYIYIYIYQNVMLT